MDESPQASRSLEVLRAEIDDLDHRILALLRERMDRVAEVADFKRHTKKRIRDFAREASLLSDRRKKAKALGLPAGPIESMWRLVLWTSRDRQAALGAELPLEFEKKTVAILGAKGGMGELLVGLFGGLGHEVLEVDLDTDLKAEQAAEKADVVVVSVPINRTVEVIASVGKHMRRDALLMDVTSIKKAPLEAMLAHTEASVLATHPMFGPNVHSLQGQRVVFCSGRGEPWEAWAEQNFRARGLTIVRSDAATHDRAMSVVQVLNHFQTQVFGLALARSGISLEDTLSFASPAYLLELYVAARHFAQSPELYGAIEMNNPRKSEVVALFAEAVEAIAKPIVAAEQEHFRALFDEVRAYFGKDFQAEAAEQSSFLIDRLVERS